MARPDGRAPRSRKECWSRDGSFLREESESLPTRRRLERRPKFSPEKKSGLQTEADNGRGGSSGCRRLAPKNSEFTAIYSDLQRTTGNSRKRVPDANKTVGVRREPWNRPEQGIDRQTHWNTETSAIVAGRQAETQCARQRVTGFMVGLTPTIPSGHGLPQFPTLIFPK